jgi:hypothetical protein
MPRKQKNGVRPERYVPDSLTNEDKLKQVLMLLKSRSDYEEKTFQTRKKLPSFKSKPSSHVETAKKMYGVRSMTHTKKLAEATDAQAALKKIINKGEGRITRRVETEPNRRSWGLARLASSITGGPAAKVDFHIIDESCDHDKPAHKLAVKAKAAKTKKNKSLALR